MSRKRIALVWAAFVSCMAGLGSEAQVVRESFDGAAYTVGVALDGLNGGTGFSGPWSESGSRGEFDTIQSGSLSYPGFPSTGNSVLSVPPSDYFSAPFRTVNSIAGVDGTSLWIGYLFRKESDNTLGAPVTEDYFGLVVYGSAANEGVFIGDPGDSTSFALGTAGAASTAGELSSIAVPLKNTAFLVAKVSFHAGADTVQLFVNPNISAGEPKTPSATKTNLDLGNISGLGLLAGYNAVYSYDEIRAGPTFSSLVGVPAPTLGITLTPAGAVVVTYDGVLESRSSLDAGAWATLEGASPLMVPKAQLEKSRFFRARSR